MLSASADFSASPHGPSTSRQEARTRWIHQRLDGRTLGVRSHRSQPKHILGPGSVPAPSSAREPSSAVVSQSTVPVAYAAMRLRSRSPGHLVACGLFLTQTHSRASSSGWRVEAHTRTGGEVCLQSTSGLEGPRCSCRHHGRASLLSGCTACTACHMSAADFDSRNRQIAEGRASSGFGLTTDLCGPGSGCIAF